MEDRMVGQEILIFTRNL